MADLGMFQWQVAREGYRWRSRIQDGPGRLDTRYLEPLSDFPFEVRRYEPLRDEPALFRILADLRPVNEESVIAFANQYGRLGVRQKQASWLDFSERPFIETLEVWQTAVDQLSASITVWDSHRDGYWKRSHASASVDRKMAEFVGNVFSSASDQEHAIAEHLPALPDRSSLSLDQAALLSVGANIRRHLIELGVCPFVTYQEHPQRLALEFVPRTLLGALWLQFAQAVDKGRDYRRCKECSKWFVITHDNEGRRKTRRFCADACRSKAYRRRLTDAHTLHEDGAQPEEIAEQLGVELAVVRRWLARKGPERPNRS